MRVAEGRVGTAASTALDSLEFWMNPSRLSAFLLLAVVASAASGCSRSTLAPADGATPERDIGVLGDAGTVDTVSPLPDVPDVFVPSFPTPPRSAELDRLYCSLDNGQLVRSAVMAGACLNLSMAGVLDDAARGFVYGPMMQGGYGRATLGNCDLLACLAAAPDCAAAEACDLARQRGPCDPNVDVARCDGNVLEACQWDGAGASWLAVQDCTRMGSVCQELNCGGMECRREAVCAGTTPVERCGFYDTCIGDAAFRCAAGGWSSQTTAAFAIDCSELIEDGTCRETAVGGEAPGATCLPVDAECQQNFGDGFVCNLDGTMQICLFGRLEQIDCNDFGFSSCADGFFAQRCVP